ncbi:MAG: DUF4832 domain-containing protein [Candidatus Gastranaerophilales bacterium]|nr:DUF4832 domain-containing protein [Candidatus Gastranaerophilales bacterium]
MRKDRKQRTAAGAKRVETGRMAKEPAEWNKPTQGRNGRERAETGRNGRMGLFTMLFPAGILFVVCTLLAVCVLHLRSELEESRRRVPYARGHGSVTVESIAFTESAKRLDNPNRGFYYMHGFRIDDEETDYREEVAKRFCRDEDTELAMIQVNLQAYRNRPISQEGLENLERLFQALEAVDKRYIVRFLYDWDGEIEDYEPEKLEVILEHIRQTGPVLRKHRGAVFTLQGLFIGNWGEMNGTEFANQEDIRLLAEQLYESTGGELFLAVRMPMQWRMATGVAWPPERETESLSALEDAGQEASVGLAFRLGLYNDGMLGSWSDYGTYGDQTREEHGAFTYWNREEELAFQEELCKTVPMGGEVIIDNPYNDFENALVDMKRMHVTYLNKDFDKNVLDKWARYTVSEEGCFQGMDGLTYMERHLGYRLLIADVDLRYASEEDLLSVSAAVRNVGFAPLYDPAAVRIRLVDSVTGAVRSYEAAHELGTLSGGNEAERTAAAGLEFSLTGLAAGRYELYLEVVDETSGKRILLANEQEPEEYGYRIGTVELGPVEPEAMEEERTESGPLESEWTE